MPDQAPAQFPHGYYEFGFSLVGASPADTLIELKKRLDMARMRKFSGWPLFLNLRVPNLQQSPQEEFIEAWLGNPIPEQPTMGSAFSDFWRASPDGKLYTIQGYLED